MLTNEIPVCGVRLSQQLGKSQGWAMMHKCSLVVSSMEGAW